MIEVSEGEQIEEPESGPTLEEQCLYEQALQVMEPRDQAVLVPFYVYQYSAADIAAALGIGSHRVHESIRQGLERTRAKLEESRW